MTRRAVVADPSQIELPLFEPVPPAAGSASEPLRRSAEPAPGAPEIALADALTPTLFRHPRASREIDLGRAVVAYEFQRVRRRSIGMVVSGEGLTVRAPRWVGWSDIEAALREKAGWIQAKLAEQHERARRLEAARIEWRDGSSLPFLGETLVVALDARTTGAVLERAADAPPGAARLTLHVGLPQQAEPEQIRDVVQAWLKRQALRVFEERCAHYAPLLRVQVRRLALSSAQTRWGSASADGSIRLNWRLIHFALPTIDYVVAHELAHLREMNHGPRFWDVVRSVIPDVDQARGTLRHETLPA
jgi:predicted metal-dependent hydrolase